MRDITSFALMVATLTNKPTPPEPARPGPSRVYRSLVDEAEDARTLDGGSHDVPAVSDFGARLIASLIASLIATAGTTKAQHPARPKLTAVDAEVDGPNAGGSASVASGEADQTRLEGLPVAKSGQVVANGGQA